MQLHLLFMRDIMLVIHNSVGDRKQRVSFYNAVAADVAVVRCRMQKGSRERRQSGYALADSSTDSQMENQGELLQTPWHAFYGVRNRIYTLVMLTSEQMPQKQAKREMVLKACCARLLKQH